MNTFTDKLITDVKNVNNLTNFTFTGFASEAAMLTEWEEQPNNKLWAGIVFTSDTTTASPTDLKYTLRVTWRNGKADGDRWRTELTYPFFQAFGPRNKEGTGGEPFYHDTGFLTLQYLINKEFIKLKNSTSDIGTGLNVSMQKMPYPPYLDDVLATVLQSNLPLFLVFSFILNTIQMAMNLAYEKEKKLKEAMKMMGLKTSMYWISWFVKNLIYLVLVIIAYTLIFSIKLQEKGRVINYADMSLFFVFLLLYILALIAFAFMVSTFFSKANSAAFAAGILYFLTYFPYFFLTNNYETMSKAEKYVACLLHNQAMAFGIKSMLIYEGTAGRRRTSISRKRNEPPSDVDYPVTPLVKDDQRFCQSLGTGQDGVVVSRSSSDLMTHTMHTGDIDHGTTGSMSDHMAAAILRSLSADPHLDSAADPDLDIAGNEDVGNVHVDSIGLTIRIVVHHRAHLTTTASVSTPRVSSTVSSRVPPTATLSNPDTLWIQNSAGHFVPVNADNLPSSGLHYQFTDVGDDHSLLPDNYNPVQDILTSVPADSIQTAGVVESEADSDAESNVETDQYLAPIGQIYELMFRTLGEDYCPRPAELSSNATISVTEQLFRTFDPNRVIKSTARPDPRLPIGSTVLSVLQSLESANKTIPKQGETWKIPKELADPKHQEGFLFGGRIQEAITADKDDQLHASLARNNSGQRQGVFKHPASMPPAVPAFKTAKRNNLFSKKPSFNPRSGPNRQSSYNRPSLSHKSSNKDSGKKGKPKPGQRNFKPSTGRGAPPAYQP
ncbi:hypothetical protein DPMN_118707 [Dreissena polymorpha]|uniref:ABC-2 type transporter transmembrane domain-containing protein n=1 Tax=Dreissena polymorpha TaxID=45954 RepID=A0A9D4JRB8_DREPO|nr:hypothetical protein DPMN_118707 [Dreissena polymorpha]